MTRHARVDWGRLGTIKAKLALSAVAVVAALAGVTIGWMVAFGELKVNGPIYARLVQSKDLIADILPPPAYILESYLEASQALDSSGETLAGHKTAMIRLKQEYEARHAFWANQNLDQTIRDLFLIESRHPAVTFYDRAFDAFFPALERGDRAAALGVFNEMSALYARHRQAIDRLVERSVVLSTSVEADALAREHDFKVTVAAVTALAILLVVGGLIGLARSIVVPVGRMTEVVSALARGNSAIGLPDRTRRDEIGTLARGIEVLRGVVEEAYRLNQLVETQPAAIMLCGTDYRISYANRAALGIVARMRAGAGRPIPEVVGANLFDFHAVPHNVHRIIDDIAGMPHYGKFTMAGVTIENTVDVVRDKSGAVVGTMLSWNDVSDYIHLSESFESEVKTAAQSVVSACTQLDNAAKAMAAVARDTRGESEIAAAAAAMAIGHAQSAATATFDLSQSVGEIAREVANSAELARSTAEEARTTGATLASLAESADKIGEVVSLINDIAAQTDLLALNATIEAARAGEAGKGFAVVAGAVKGLANQTARATEDIGVRMRGMQEITRGTIAAIERIIARVGEIDAASAGIAAALARQSRATDVISGKVQSAATGTDRISASITAVVTGAEVTGRTATEVSGGVSDLVRQASNLEAGVTTFLDRMRAMTGSG